MGLLCPFMGLLCPFSFMGFLCSFMGLICSYVAIVLISLQFLSFVYGQEKAHSKYFIMLSKMIPKRLNNETFCPKVRNDNILLAQMSAFTSKICKHDFGHVL